MKRSIIFTDKMQSHRAWFSLFLGMISNVSLDLAIYRSYRQNGEGSFGGTAFLAGVFAALGLFLAYWVGKKEQYFGLLPRLAIGLHLLAWLQLGLIMFAGMTAGLSV